MLYFRTIIIFILYIFIVTNQDSPTVVEIGPPIALNTPPSDDVLNFEPPVAPPTTDDGSWEHNDAGVAITSTVGGEPTQSTPVVIAPTNATTTTTTTTTTVDTASESPTTPDTPVPPPTINDGSTTTTTTTTTPSTPTTSTEPTTTTTAPSITVPTSDTVTTDLPTPPLPPPTGHWTTDINRLLILAEQISDFNKSDNILDSLVRQPKPAHLTHDQLTERLRSIEANFPSIAKLTSIGKSVQGRDLWVLEISDNVGEHEDGEPQFKYVGNMHGNEVISRVILTCLCDLLTLNYGRSELITRLVDSVRISILVSMNPDGYAISEPDNNKATNSNGKGRENANNVDLNRNFPDRLGGKSAHDIQPETEAVMRWSLDNNFVMSANLHGGSLVANYPYDNSKSAVKPKYAISPDDKEFRYISESYSLAHFKMHKRSGCPYDEDVFEKGITNGAAWYDVPGGMQDWSYIHTGALSITLEVSCLKYPSSDRLPQYWRDNANALLVFISQIHTGVSGYVTDKLTKERIVAVNIKVKGIDHDVQSTEAGDYWRLLPPGEYVVTASTEGFKPQKALVTVKPGYNPSTPLNFTLDYPWSRSHDFDIAENLSPHYLSANDFVDELHKIVRSMPYLSSLKRLSNSVSSEQDVFAFQLSNQSVTRNPDIPEHRIKVTFIGSLNADSPLGGEMLIRFIRNLVYGYTTGDNKTRILFQNTALTFLIIRNYDLETLPIPNDCKGEHFKGQLFEYMFSNKKESGSVNPEVDFIKRIFMDDPQHLVVSLQGQGHTVRYPLSFTDDDLHMKTADDETFKYLANSMIYDSVFDACGSQTPYIMNDAEGGNKANSLMDFLYHNYGTLMITKNIDCCKYPSGDSLPKVYELIQPLMFSFLKAAQQGVVGIILPKKAHDLKVKVNDRAVRLNKDNTFFTTLAAGSHSISIQAKGYVDFAEEFTVKREDSVSVTFTLVKSSGRFPYRDSLQAQALYKNLTEKYPSSLFSVRTIGRTVLGKPIDALVLGTSEPRARVRLVAGIDGRDWVNREFMLVFVETLLQRYSSDPLTKNLLDKIQISVVPSLNVDGAFQAEKGSCDVNDGMSNANGVNLDKLFRLAFYQNSFLMEQPETRAFVQWSENVTFSLTVSFGIGHYVAVYPQGRTHDETAIALDLAHNYATMNPDFLHNNCSESAFKGGVAPSSRVTGDSESSLRDWTFKVLGSLSLSLYTSCCGFPDDDGAGVASVWNHNFMPLLHLITKMEKGVSGSVSDLNGHLDNVTLTLADYPSYRYVTGEDGKYYFYLPKGVYTIVATRPDYYNTTKEIIIGDSKDFEVNIVMAENMTSDSFLITIGITLLLVSLLVMGCVILLIRVRNRKVEYSFHKLDGMSAEEGSDTDQELDLTARELLSTGKSVVMKKKKKMMKKGAVVANNNRLPASNRNQDQRSRLFDSDNSSEEEIF